jgi:hypothetical protein
MEENKRESLMLLIEDSIVNAKLINSLEALGIDASLYSSSSVAIIYNLLYLESELSRDDFYYMYFDLIKEGEGIDFANTRVQLRRFAECIVLKLMEYAG